MTQENAIEVVQGEIVSLGAIRTAGPMDVIRRASEVATELAKIVQAKKLYTTIQGRKFVQVEGWSTLGAMLGVLPREVPGSIIRYDDGSYEAAVELIRTSDGAVISRASAFCGVDEKDRNGRSTWGNRPEYARRSMAVTRATGKAYRLGFSWIMTLAGYEPTPAEEMPDELDNRPALQNTPRTPQPAPQPRPEPPTPPEPEQPQQPEPEKPQQPEEQTELQAAMQYRTRQGRRLGEMNRDELSQLLDWCDAHPGTTDEPRQHILVLLDYLRTFEQPQAVQEQMPV